MISLILFALVAHASDRSPIDLGELKIQGDVRRPMTAFYQLKSMHETQLQELADLSFSDFENALLQPPKKEAPHDH